MVGAAAGAQGALEEGMSTPPRAPDSFSWLLAILRDIALIVFVIVYVIHTV